MSVVEAGLPATWRLSSPHLLKCVIVSRSRARPAMCGALPALVPGVSFPSMLLLLDSASSSGQTPLGLSPGLEDSSPPWLGSTLPRSCSSSRVVRRSPATGSFLSWERKLKSLKKPALQSIHLVLPLTMKIGKEGLRSGQV